MPFYKIIILLCRIEFLKSYGSTLKVPNVLGDFEYSGDKVKMICGQGSLYLRSLYPLLDQSSSGQSPPISGSGNSQSSSTPPRSGRQSSLQPVNQSHPQSLHPSNPPQSNQPESSHSLCSPTLHQSSLSEYNCCSHQFGPPCSTPTRFDQPGSSHSQSSLSPLLPLQERQSSSNPPPSNQPGCSRSLPPSTLHQSGLSGYSQYQSSQPGCSHSSSQSLPIRNGAYVSDLSSDDDETNEVST